MVWCVLNESKCETMKTLISQDDDDDDDDDIIDFFQNDYDEPRSRSAAIHRNTRLGRLHYWAGNIYYSICTYILYIYSIDIFNLYIYCIVF